MAKSKNQECYSSKDHKMNCCNVESVITIDERGQMVLPKDVREKAQIHAGDKLAIIAMKKDGKICCLSMIKVEEIEQMVKGILGPVMKEIL